MSNTQKIWKMVEGTRFALSGKKDNTQGRHQNSFLIYKWLLWRGLANCSSKMPWGGRGRQREWSPASGPVPPLPPPAPSPPPWWARPSSPPSPGMVGLTLFRPSPLPDTAGLTPLPLTPYATAASKEQGGGGKLAPPSPCGSTPCCWQTDRHFHIYRMMINDFSDT